MLMVHVDFYFDCECFVVDGAVVVLVVVEIFVAVVLVAVVSSVFIDAIGSGSSILVSSDVFIFAVVGVGGTHNPNRRQHALGMPSFARSVVVPCTRQLLPRSLYYI